MSYFTDLFTPETWGKFREHGSTVSGFPKRQQTTAEQLKLGDLFCCYVTRLSRWCGVLEVISGVYINSSPIFMEPDPYVVRVRVRPVVVLDFELAIPIFDKAIWPNLSVTRDIEFKAFGWAQFANLRTSLRRLSDEDGELLVSALKDQVEKRRIYPLSQQEQKRLTAAITVRTTDKPVFVEVPDDEGDDGEPAPVPEAEAQPLRDSLKVQASLARIGIGMGFRVWVPKADKQSILTLIPPAIHSAFLDQLPLNYDDVTLRTIEQIDVIWLNNRAIARAFEVEHTTAVYSGLLRMADLLALQPNMDIRLHIVAPNDKQDKVLREIKRPVFSLLDKGPLYESCSYLPYSAITEISEIGHLNRMKDSIIEDFEIYAQEE